MTSPEFVIVRAATIRWLLGESGVFECPPDQYFRGKEPRYWWRRQLRAAVLASPPQAHAVVPTGSSIAHGRLAIMGQIETVEDDEGSMHPMALLIEFDSVESYSKAISDEQCSFGNCDAATDQERR